MIQCGNDILKNIILISFFCLMNTCSMLGYLGNHHAKHDYNILRRGMQNNNIDQIRK